jgi:hypothetical protein
MQSFCPGRNHIKSYFDEYVEVDIPDGFTQKQRSRYLKTTLRKWVSGDFLYVDTDTVIAGSISEIDNCTENIAMALDVCYEKQKKHFNSGVIYAKDSKFSLDFFDQWHAGWLEGVAKGIDNDQPSLYLLTAQMDGFRTLSSAWNFQIKLKRNDKGLTDAKIVHYFNLDIAQNYYVNDDCMLLLIKYMDGLPPLLIEKLHQSVEDVFVVKYTMENRAYVRLRYSYLSLLTRSYPIFFRGFNSIAFCFWYTISAFKRIRIRL